MITITAPKKGLGQTITSINIATKMGDLLKDRVLLVDINQYCCGVEDYLSNTAWTRGLDEFKNDIESGHGGRDAKGWVKDITPRLDIMASNRYFQLNEKDVKELRNYTDQIYAVTLIDSIAGTNHLTVDFCNDSKVVIVILNQDRSLIRLIKDKNLYSDIKDKVIFVINRYQNSYEDSKVNYGVKEITENLAEMGFNKEVYTLPFDVRLLNETNDNTLLNYCLTTEKIPTQYHIQIKKLVEKILKDYCDFNLEEDSSMEKKKRNIFNLFNL